MVLTRLSIAFPQIWPEFAVHNRQVYLLCLMDKFKWCEGVIEGTVWQNRNLLTLQHRFFINFSYLPRKFWHYFLCCWCKTPILAIESTQEFETANSICSPLLSYTLNCLSGPKWIKSKHFIAIYKFNDSIHIKMRRTFAIFRCQLMYYK